MMAIYIWKYSEEEGWLDNKLHVRRKYMCENYVSMQQDA
jgi:hypothetical protein